MENKNNKILEESIDRISDLLGDELDKITIDRAVFGLFFSGVKLSSGQGGLCFTPIKDIPEAVCCPSSAKAMPLSGKLVGKKASEYLDYIFGGNVLKRTLGIATLNALSTLCWEKFGKGLTTLDGREYEIVKGVDAFDELELIAGEKAVVIGALVPMLKRLIKADQDFKVLEMDPRTLKGEELNHYAPASDAGKYLPEADLIVITGTTIINDTLEGILAMAKPSAKILVTGPTVSMLPDSLFERGVTLLGGIMVNDPDQALDIVAEAGSGYHLFGKSVDRTVIRLKVASNEAR